MNNIKFIDDKDDFSILIDEVLWGKDFDKEPEWVGDVMLTAKRSGFILHLNFRDDRPEVSKTYVYDTFQNAVENLILVKAIYDKTLIYQARSIVVLKSDKLNNIK